MFQNANHFYFILFSFILVPNRKGLSRHKSEYYSREATNTPYGTDDDPRSRSWGKDYYSVDTGKEFFL